MRATSTLWRKTRPRTATGDDSRLSPRIPSCANAHFPPCRPRPTSPPAGRNRHFGPHRRPRAAWRKTRPTAPTPAIVRPTPAVSSRAKRRAPRTAAAPPPPRGRISPESGRRVDRPAAAAPADPRPFLFRKKLCSFRHGKARILAQSDGAGLKPVTSPKVTPLARIRSAAVTFLEVTAPNAVPSLK